MWVVLEGAAGSGKTWLMTRLIKEQTKKTKLPAWLNYPVEFDYNHFSELPEIYHLKKAIIGVDEIQDLAGYWMYMPVTFRNQIAHHRHNDILIYTAGQDFHDLHVQIRRNVHERYLCRSALRFPKDERFLPFIQIIRVKKKVKVHSKGGDDLRYQTVGHTKTYFISRFWTRKLYDTHQNIDFEQYLTTFTLNARSPGQKIWTLKITNRDLINNKR